MTDQVANDPPQAGPTSEELWTDVQTLGRLTQRASHSGEQMAAVIFAAAGHASATRTARTRPAPARPTKIEAAVAVDQPTEVEPAVQAPPSIEEPAEVEPVAPAEPVMHEPVELPVDEQIDWPEPEPEPQTQPEPQAQPVAQIPNDPPATYPLLGEAMPATALGDDDSDTVDMQPPAPLVVTPRVSRVRRTFHWAALIAFATIAGLLYTGKLHFPVIEQAIARQAMDSIITTPADSDTSGNLPPALDAAPPPAQADAPVESDSRPALVNPHATETPVPVEAPASAADEPPLIILPTDVDNIDVEPAADNDSGARTLFDEPMGDAGRSHVPAPSLFGPDPIVPGMVVADAHSVRDEPAEDYFAQDVAEWIAAHQQAWFPAPDTVRESMRVRRDRAPVRHTTPQWLDEIIYNAVRGSATPSMYEPSVPLLP